LTLGQTLSGGADKIEDVRVGVLALRRDVEAVKDQVVTRRAEVAALLEQKRRARKEIGVGRELLEIAERMEVLEGKLGLATTTVKKDGVLPVDGDSSLGEPWSDGWTEDPAQDDSEDEYNDDDGVLPMFPRLKQRVEDFLILRHLLGRHDAQHPFILAQDTRVHKIQDTILTDLDAAIRQEPQVKMKQQLMQIRSAVAD
jgi:conserved oligomeric Golgi complex subunit 2